MCVPRHPRKIVHVLRKIVSYQVKQDKLSNKQAKLSKYNTHGHSTYIQVKLSKYNT